MSSHQMFGKSAKVTWACDLEVFQWDLERHGHRENSHQRCKGKQWYSRSD